MANPFVHAELNTTDVEKSKNFYGELFDWKYEEIPGAEGLHYTSIGVGENKYGVGGGMLKQRMPGAGSAWMPYVLVDDIEAATRKAEKLGAKILKDVTDVADMGSLSIFQDPTGAIIGLWQTKM
jgi:predicted enzyme related to lactoylglutathione lyase